MALEGVVFIRRLDIYGLLGIALVPGALVAALVSRVVGGRRFAHFLEIVILMRHFGCLVHFLSRIQIHRRFSHDILLLHLNYLVVLRDFTSMCRHFCLIRIDGSGKLAWIRGVEGHSIVSIQLDLLPVLLLVYFKGLLLIRDSATVDASGVLGVVFEGLIHLLSHYKQSVFRVLHKNDMRLL